MRLWTRARTSRRSLPASGSTAVLTAVVLVGTQGTSQAAAALPCDIYASAGAACV